MTRAYLALLRRLIFGTLYPEIPQSLAFARMYGELVQRFMIRGDADNAYILACRAFHHARTYQER